MHATPICHSSLQIFPIRYNECTKCSVSNCMFDWFGRNNKKDADVKNATRPNLSLSAKRNIQNISNCQAETLPRWIFIRNFNGRVLDMAQTCHFHFLRTVINASKVGRCEDTEIKPLEKIKQPVGLNYLL
jgi:hypothetical protein